VSREQARAAARDLRDVCARRSSARARASTPSIARRKATRASTRTSSRSTAARRAVQGVRHADPRLVVGQRGTHVCPNCQPKPRRKRARD
jgi:hypothetical protein